jgi:hypothetical protein
MKIIVSNFKIIMNEYIIKFFNFFSIIIKIQLFIYEIIKLFKCRLNLIIKKST